MIYHLMSTNGAILTHATARQADCSEDKMLVHCGLRLLQAWGLAPGSSILETAHHVHRPRGSVQLAWGWGGGGGRMGTELACEAGSPALCVTQTQGAARWEVGSSCLFQTLSLSGNLEKNNPSSRKQPCIPACSTESQILWQVQKQNLRKATLTIEH